MTSLSARPRPALTLAAVCLAGGLLPASLTGASIALPDIGSDLQADLVSVQWVVNAYNLTFAAFMLVMGSLADRLGRRRMFAVGSLLFAVCSLLSIFAGGILFLVLARALSGVGAAAMLTGGSAMLPTVYRGARLGWAFGVLGASFGAGLALGPSLSGLIVGEFGWSGVFVLHLSICILVLLSIPFLQESRDPEPARFDVAGALTFTVGLLLLVLAMVQGPQWGWGSAGVLLLFAGFVLLMVLFVVVEKMQQKPMFDLSLLRQPRFVAVCLIPVVLAFGFVSLLVFLPPYFIGTLGYSVEMSGLVLLILTIPVLVLPIVSGTLSRRVPIHVLLGVSLLLVGGGAAWLTVIGPGVSVLSLAGPLAVIGVGVGISFGLLDGAAISSAPPERAGMAAGMFNTARLTSEAAVIAGMGSLLVSLTQHNLNPEPSALEMANRAAQGQGHARIAAAVDPSRVDELSTQITSAYTDALVLVLWMLAAICVLGAPLIVALLRDRAGTPTAHEDHLAEVTS